MGAEGGQVQLPGQSLDLWDEREGRSSYWSESSLERGEGGQVQLPGQGLDFRKEGGATPLPHPPESLDCERVAGPVSEYPFSPEDGEEG